MKKRSKKGTQVSAKKTAKAIAGSIWDFLQKLPAKERKKRLDHAHRSMKAKLVSVKASSDRANIDPKGASRPASAPVRLVAGGGR